MVIIQNAKRAASSFFKSYPCYYYHLTNKQDSRIIILQTNKTVDFVIHLTHGEDRPQSDILCFAYACVLHCSVLSQDQAQETD